MLDEPTHSTRRPSPWWLVLLLPVCLLVGWLVGQLPGPKPKEPNAGEQQGVAPISMRATSPGHVAGEVTPSDPAPQVIVSPTPEAPREEVSQWTSLESAMAESRRNGKPILIDFNADWCGPCRAMKQQVFEDWQRGRTVQTTVIPVSIVDRVREEGRNSPEIEDLQQRFQVDAFPTLVVFSPQSGAAARTQGFGDADQTLAWITQAAKSLR